MDVLAGTSCQLVPGTVRWGAGWYLVASNTRVEAGPFLTKDAAWHAALWMEDESLGVHPGPYRPRYSATGLLIGSRVRDRKPVATRPDGPDLERAG